jgi:hypothetical protein
MLIVKVGGHLTVMVKTTIISRFGSVVIWINSGSKFLALLQTKTIIGQNVSVEIITMVCQNISIGKFFIFWGTLYQTTLLIKQSKEAFAARET